MRTDVGWLIDDQQHRSVAYYDLKRGQQKKHTEALIALARRRTDVLYAMLRDNKPHAHPTPAAA